MKHIRFYEVRDGQLHAATGRHAVLELEYGPTVARAIYRAQERAHELQSWGREYVACRIYTDGRPGEHIYDLTSWPSASWSEEIRTAIANGVVE